MRILAIFLTLSATSVVAADLGFDASNSSLKFVGDYSGEPVPGVFKSFAGTVSLDLATPMATRFRTEIDVASLDTDYADRDDTLRGPEFFDASAHPTALWVSTGDCSGSLNALNCPGELKLKGKTVAVPIAVTVAPDGRSIIGKATVNRLDFDIGSGEWEDADTIRHDIAIEFELKL